MRLLEIQRQLKKNHRYKDGNYIVEVRLEHPGNVQEILRILVMENDTEVAKALFKQWPNSNKWEPLSVSTKEFNQHKHMQNIIERAIIEAGYLC